MIRDSFQNSWFYIGLTFIVLLGLCIHWESLFELPSYIHARAQSDRFAIALNYFHNGFNPFKSETYLFNVEFPYNFRVPKENTIVSVDLPVHEYLIALIMKLIGDKSPIVFRLYMLLYSFIGLISLFKTGKLLKLGWASSYLLVLFVITIPVYIYYQDSFLPTITSFSSMLIATYFYLKYSIEGKLGNYSLSILFLVLASISRSIYVIPLLSVVGIEGLYILKKAIIEKKGFDRKTISLILTSFVLLLPVFAQYLYNNNYMRYEYGSVFLYYLVPAKSFAQFVSILKSTIERWGFDFFTPIHYFGLILLIGFLIYLGLKKRIVFDRLSKKLLLLIVISSIGYVLFLIAMATKFPHHDYYFIDTFLIVFILFVIWSLRLISKQHLKEKSFVLKWMFVLVFSVPGIYFAKSNFDERRLNRSWDNIPEVILNFNDIAKIFRELNIEKDAKVLVVGPYAPNLPLLMMDRKGYAAMHKSREDMLSALSWDLDYIILQNELYIKEYYPHFPEFIFQLKSIYNNGNITIARKRGVPEKVQVEEFFKIEKGENLESQRFVFELDSSENWTNVNRVHNVRISDKLIGFINQESEFGLTYKSRNFERIVNKKTNLEIRASVYCENQPDKSSLVISIGNKEKKIFYQSELLSSLLDTSKTDQWQKLYLSINLPKFEKDNQEFSFYIWNKKEEFYIDSIMLDFYSME